VEIVRARYGPDVLERVGYTGALREPMRATLLAPLMLPPFLGRLWAVAAREARDFRPDVVHAHWWMPGGWIASRLGIPYLVTCHGTDVRLLEKPFWRALAAPVMRRAGAITTASEFLAKDIARFMPEVAKKISVTSMPMDIELFERGANVEKASPPRVLYAGNLIASKGVDVLIEAIAILRERGVPCQLRIIGAGPEEARLHALAAARSLEGAISWSPFVSQHALPAEFGAATVTVLVSRGQAEGLGLVLAEALLAGSAVVGTAAGGIPEVVVDERTGLIAKDGDAADLARQIERLLTDAVLRERTIAAGRERVGAQHAPVAAAERVIGLYDEVAKQRSRA
jgi:glycosyltransferase involved in cell wall biosynthesis